MLMQSMMVEEKCPTVAELMNSPLSYYNNLAANNCKYSGTVEELIANYVHPFFFKSKSAISRRKIQIGVRSKLEYFLTIIGNQ